MTTILPPPDTLVPGQGVFRVLYGSHAHGTATPTSDTDWRGVYLLPNDAFLGLDMAKTTFEVKASDEVYWELGHFCRLLLKGNPNIVGMLFAPGDCIADIHPAFQPLLDNRERFIHRDTAKAYLGWVHREAADIAKLHKGNAKRLSHVPRLLWELEDMLQYGTIRVRPSDWRRDYIVGVKTGTVAYDDAVAAVGSMLLDIDAIADVALAKLPEPPREWTERFLLAVREGYGR